MSYLIRAAMMMVFMSVPAYLAAANFALFEPYLLPLHLLKSAQQPVSEYVIVGPYPGPSDLARLKQSGVTAVVSLLDPSVVYEKSLLARESEDAPRAGLHFLSVPVRRSEALWSATNWNSARRLRMLFAAERHEKVYVHGFLDIPRDVVALEARTNRPVASAGN